MDPPSKFTVKPEPREVGLLSLQYPTDPQPGQSGSRLNVKAEPNDATRVFTDMGLPIPPYMGSNPNAPVKSEGGFQANLKREDVGAGAHNAVAPANDNRAINPSPIHFSVFKSVDEVDYTPENALQQGIKIVKTMRTTLKKLELGSKLRQEVWDREMTNLEGQGAPKTLIAVCGATGAGKSSILNAVLDDNIVPTSGMKACTAVVTEISYHKKPGIEADVSFLSEAEWRQELGLLLHDLVDEDGNIRRFNDLKSDAGVAWQKVSAVYPKIEQEQLVKMSVDQILGHDPLVRRVLGATKTVVAKDSKTFAKEIGKYIDSKEKRGKKDKDKSKDKTKEPSLMDKVRQAAGMAVVPRNDRNTGSSSSETGDAALWPLIRQVNVRCRSEALSTGAVLVDLPGVADANAARNKIAKDYMKKCNCIWILAPITRAVDDKTARDLLGDAFKMQLMNGNYDDHAITFIASKCDDISCSEVIQQLRLDDEPELEAIEDRLVELRKEASEAKRVKKQAEAHIKVIEGGLEDIRTEMQHHEDHLEALQNGETFVPTLKKKKANKNSKKRKNARGGKKSSPKRRRSLADDDDEEDDFIASDDEPEESDNDSDDSGSGSGSASSDGDEEDEDAEMNDVTEDDLKKNIQECKARIKSQRQILHDAKVNKKSANDTLASVEKTLVKFQKQKNAFCALRRNEFSREVLKEDFRTGLKDLDDAAAEERDPDNFNPNIDLRDYKAIDLPVFTCSSRDYVRLKGQVQGDGEPACFSNISDTGVPDLQKWCHQLTIASRERSTISFFTHLKAFATSVSSYVQGIGDVTALDRSSLQDKWESRGFADEAEQLVNVNDFDNIWGLPNRNPPPPPKVDQHGKFIGVTPRLCEEFGVLIDECREELQERFKDGLEEKCRVGAANAAGAALETLDEFTNSMHWATYRATLRRHGSWRRDLNVELVGPFTRNIAHSWCKVFEADLFASFLENTISAINKLVKEVEESAAVGLKDRAKKQGELCVEEARVALKNAIELVKEAVNSEQKEVSRSMAPHVQVQLIEGYNTAMEERGTGSVARQKAYFRGYINNCKDEIFDDGADVVLDRLAEAAEAVAETLDDAMGKLAQKIEVSLAVLWEGALDNPTQLRARKETVDIMNTIQDQIELWTEAAKVHKNAIKSADDAMDED